MRPVRVITVVRQAGRSLLLSGLTLAGWGLAQGLAPSTLDVDYSMTVQMFEGGRPQGEAKIYVGNGAYRMESPDSTMIFLPDQEQVLFFDHKSKSYLEMPATPSGDSALPAENSADRSRGSEDQGDCVEVGSDTIAGVPATKMACEQDGQATWVWADSNGVALQISEGEESNITMKVLDYVVGPQPESLFAPLEGYSKQEMPAGFPGGNLP